MVKEARAGRVKTRLGRDLGMVGAAWWYRHQTASLLRRLRDRRWRIVLSVSPDMSGLTNRMWPADLMRIPQGTGDLGTRMARALAMTPGPTLLVGSDIPGITPVHIARAFSRMPAGGSLIGPSTDGGYWMVGLDHPSQFTPRLFQGVRWSSPHTLQDTLVTLPHPVGRADTLTDIDTLSDLHLLKNTPGRSGGAAPPR